MYYSLNENVYLVEGKCNSCLYDFNNGKLYRINQHLSALLKRINDKNTCEQLFSNTEKNVLNDLCDKALVIQSEKHNVTSIFELCEDREKNIDYAWIEITTKCNLKCIHCYNEASSICAREMSLENYIEIIDVLVNYGIKKVQLIGGEPFFNSELLKQMLDYTVGKFDSIEIFTNGTLITEEWADYIAKHNIHVGVSVYSYDDSSHDSVTKCIGSHERTNQAINMLYARNIKYRVCNVLMKDVQVGVRNTEKYSLSEEKDIVRMSGRASFSLLTRELLRKKLITQNTFKKPLNKYFTMRIISGHNCFGKRIYISVDKKIYPCPMERRICHGTIEKKQLPLESTILNFNKDKIDKCKECEYRYTCFDCRPNSLDGELYEQPWYCTYNPSKGEWADVEKFIDELIKKYK